MQNTTQSQRTKQINIDTDVWERARLRVLQRKVEDPRYSIKQLVEDAVNRELASSAA